MPNKYPRCSCGCGIELTEINGSYLCYRCMKLLEPSARIVNKIMRAEKEVEKSNAKLANKKNRKVIYNIFQSANI